MIEIQVDRRRLEIGSAADAERIVDEEIAWSREHDMVLARALVVIEQQRAYVGHACSCAEDYAVRKGLDRARATELLRLGRALDLAPEIAVDVRAGRVTQQAIATVGRFVPPTPAIPPKSPPDADVEKAEREALEERVRDWAEKAQVLPPSTLRTGVRAQIEEIKQGERVVPLHFLVKEGTRWAWRRARKLATRRAKRALTAGEAFELVTNDYLDRHDELRREPRARRTGPTNERPADRYVPAEVRRAVTLRSQDHCEFPGCAYGTFTQLAHDRPHAEGGDREVSNLGHLCTVHHSMQDAGLIRLWERTPMGAVFLILATGELVGPEPAQSAAAPLPSSGSSTSSDLRELETDDRGEEADEPTAHETSVPIARPAPTVSTAETPAALPWARGSPGSLELREPALAWRA